MFFDLEKISSKLPIKLSVKLSQLYLKFIITEEENFGCAQLRNIKKLRYLKPNFTIVSHNQNPRDMCFLLFIFI